MSFDAEHWESICARLTLPLIAAPMLRVSGPEMVVAACSAGVIGAFPTANARTTERLDDWCADIKTRLTGRHSAPACANLIIRQPDLAAHLDVLASHSVEIVITSVGSPAAVVGPLHDAGALVLADVASLKHAHRALEAGADGLVLLAAGAGGHTGWKLRESDSAQAEHDTAVDELFSNLRQAAKPIIAMIHGYCLGAGMAIALACDIRLGDEDSSFAIPAGRLGIGYPVELTRALVSVVGPGHASAILFEGARFDARHAVRIGLLNRTHRTDDLETAVSRLAATISANAPLSLRAAKLSIRSHLDRTLSDQAAAAVAACRDSPDAEEGPRAFREKRAPYFTGR
ncbi:MAG: hypothetical protein NVSMB48_00220 [Marmoricola sp.]